MFIKISTIFVYNGGAVAFFVALPLLGGADWKLRAVSAAGAGWLLASTLFGVLY